MDNNQELPSYFTIEDQETLGKLCRRQGLTVEQILKQGLRLYEERVKAQEIEAENYCDICNFSKVYKKGSSVCSCNGIQTYDLSTYPGEYKLVKVHPNNHGSFWYLRADVDDLIETQKEKIFETILRILNQAIDKDFCAINTLFKTKVACNPEIADHPTIQAQSNDNGYYLRIIGLINGFVELLTGKRIAEKWNEGDQTDSQIVSFVEYHAPETTEENTQGQLTAF